MVKQGVPKFTPVGNLPEETRRAAIELVAQALREQSAVLNITLHDLKYEDQPIGSYEISVRKLDD